MTKKYYLDSSIWRDYYENRSDKFRLLGDWALMLLKAIIKNNELVVYSDFVIRELNVNYSLEEINDILSVTKNKDLLFKVSTTKSQAEEAKILSTERHVAFGDALHAILARDNNAVLVSRDKHFLELLDIVDTVKPEDLI